MALKLSGTGGTFFTPVNGELVTGPGIAPKTKVVCAGTCAETATASVAADKAACEATTLDLYTATACEAVKTAASATT